MSVIVKGMEMPENCEQCVLQSDAGFCLAMPKNFCGYTETDKRADFCPLVALPDKHGRLVDADELIIDLMDRGLEGIQTDDFAEIQQTVMEQPTIVEAEGENADHD